MTTKHPDSMIHHKLRVWQRAIVLVKVVHEHLPADAELRQQVKRCSKSVAANIAEGCTMSSKAMRKKYYEIARGSAVETVAHYEMAEAIGEVLPVAEVRSHGAAVASMLTKMIKK